MDRTHEIDSEKALEMIQNQVNVSIDFNQEKGNMACLMKITSQERGVFFQRVKGNVEYLTFRARVACEYLNQLLVILSTVHHA